MTDVETLSERVRTVERAVTEGDHSFPAVDDLADLTDRLDDIERRLDELEERTADQEAATQALRGYVGNVRSVNEQVEQRADTALAATERLERRLDDVTAEHRPSARDGGGATSGLGRRDATNELHGERSAGQQRARATDGPGAGPTEDPTQRATGSGDDESSDAGVVERIRSLL